MMRTSSMHGMSGPASRRTLVVVVGLAVAGLVACEVQPKDRARIESVRQTARPGSDGVGGIGRRTGTVGVGQPVPAPDSGGSGVAVVSAEPAAVPGKPDSAGGGRTVTSPGVKVLFSDAERVFRAGDYDEAAALFEAYAARRPENPWGHYMLGISAWRAGDHPRAEAALKRTLEVDPKHVKALINLARVLLEQRKASDALEYAEQVVALEPGLGEGWRVLGNARSDLGMTEAAVEAYRQALVLDERDVWTMNNLGLLMIRQGRYEEALPSLARATELRPDVAVFQNNLGVALERSGHGFEAAEAFRAALEANPEYEKARVSLARVEANLPEEGTGPTVDLGELAALFAGEIRHWKALAVQAQEPEPVRTAGVPELDR